MAKIFMNDINNAINALLDGKEDTEVLFHDDKKEVTVMDVRTWFEKEQTKRAANVEKNKTRKAEKMAEINKDLSDKIMVILMSADEPITRDTIAEEMGSSTTPQKISRVVNTMEGVAKQKIKGKIHYILTSKIEDGE